MHTGSQTFSGDKFFFGDLFVGPTSSNGIFLYDNSGLTYSGFIGPTNSGSNIIYQLPPTVTLERFLKTCTNDGNTWGLMWATAAGGGSTLVLPGKQVGFGGGAGVTSDQDFCFDSANCDFIVSSCPTNTNSRGQSLIIGGGCNTLICNRHSSIIGGTSNSICLDSNASSILGGRSNIIFGTSSMSSIIGGCSNIVQCSSDSSSIIGGSVNLISGTSTGSSVIGGVCNRLQCNSSYSQIFGGVCNIINFNSNYSSIFGGRNNQILCLSDNSSIIGGTGNSMSNSCNSIILGGIGLTLSNCSNMVYIPQLKIQNVVESPNQNQLLMWNSVDGIVRWRNVNSLPIGSGGGGTISSFGFSNSSFAGPLNLGIGGFTNGATISYSTDGFASLTFSAANSQNVGVVSTTTQSFRGTKTFMDSVLIGSTLSAQSGIFLYDTNTYSTTYKYTGFSSPNANYLNRVLGNNGSGPTWSLSTNFIYHLPGLTGRTNQFLTIASISTSTGFTTYSTEWTYPQVGTGLTVSDTGVINLLNVLPNLVVNLPGTFSGNVFTVSIGDNGRLYDVTTSTNVIYLNAPPQPLQFWIDNPGERGFEFRVRKNDSGIGLVSVNIPEAGGTLSSPTGFPFVHLTRQNQIYEFKYNYASQSWVTYQIDMGYISPNTLIGNLTTATGNSEEYEFVDYDDSVQKALNYTEGSFKNDWLSGVIYSSIDPITYVTSNIGVSFSLFNLNKNEFIGPTVSGQNTTGGGVIIPPYALTRGKQLRVQISGTYSKKGAGTSPAETPFLFYLGSRTMSVFTYSIQPNASTASFNIDYNLKVRYGGQSGSVYGWGQAVFEELTSQAAPVYLINGYNTGYVDVDLSRNATFSVLARNSDSGGLNLTINSSTIERLS